MARVRCGRASARRRIDQAAARRFAGQRRTTRKEGATWVVLVDFGEFGGEREYQASVEGRRVRFHA